MFGACFQRQSGGIAEKSPLQWSEFKPRSPMATCTVRPMACPRNHSHGAFGMDGQSFEPCKCSCRVFRNTALFGDGWRRFLAMDEEAVLGAAPRPPKHPKLDKSSCLCHVRDVSGRLIDFEKSWSTLLRAAEIRCDKRSSFSMFNVYFVASMHVVLLFSTIITVAHIL